MRYDRSFNLCGVRSKAQITPDVLREYSNARAASRDTAAQMVGALRTRIKRNPSLDEIYAALKRLTYRNDPQCVDRAQSLETSLARQKGEGVFGDCGAFAVALSALAEAAGHGAGEWVLLGDESDPAQHIVNKFGERLIDCTPGGSANYRPRLPRQIGVDVQSGQARTFQQGQVAGRIAGGDMRNPSLILRTPYSPRLSSPQAAPRASSFGVGCACQEKPVTGIGYAPTSWGIGGVAVQYGPNVEYSAYRITFDVPQAQAGKALDVVKSLLKPGETMFDAGMVYIASTTKSGREYFTVELGKHSIAESRAESVYNIVRSAAKLDERNLKKKKTQELVASEKKSHAAAQAKIEAKVGGNDPVIVVESAKLTDFHKWYEATGYDVLPQREYLTGTNGTLYVFYPYKGMNSARDAAFAKLDTLGIPYAFLTNAERDEALAMASKLHAEQDAALRAEERKRNWETHWQPAENGLWRPKLPAKKSTLGKRNQDAVAWLVSFAEGDILFGDYTNTPKGRPEREHFLAQTWRDAALRADPTAKIDDLQPRAAFIGAISSAATAHKIDLWALYDSKRESKPTGIDGFFSDIVKGVGKVFKSIGKGVESAFKAVGDFGQDVIDEVARAGSRFSKFAINSIEDIQKLDGALGLPIGSILTLAPLSKAVFQTTKDAFDQNLNLKKSLGNIGEGLIDTVQIAAPVALTVAGALVPGLAPLAAVGAKFISATDTDVYDVTGLKKPTLALPPGTIPKQPQSSPQLQTSGASSGSGSGGGGGAIAALVFLGLAFGS